MAEKLLRQVLIGSDGRLRAFWRASIYYTAGTWLIFPLLDRAFAFSSPSLHLGTELRAGNVGFGELRNLADALICTGAFAIYERRRVGSYGLPVNRAFSRPTFEGAAAGIVMAGAVALGMISLGGLQVKGLAMSGGALILSAQWLAANIMVGVAEEAWFRSYLRQTLWKSIGFWPSANVIALIFAAEHYFFKQGENVRDVITLVSLSLLLSYS
jgi:membrane protease YdiL (CAAX protease family)